MNPGTCKHHRGSFHNKTCLAGVCYRDVTPDPDAPGSALRLPCNKELNWPGASKEQIACFEARGTCDKYEEPTAQDIADHEAGVKLAMEKFMKTLPLVGKIKKDHRGKDWQGIEVCPVCQGKIHMRHAKYNGHVWAKCETENCISFIE